MVATMVWIGGAMTLVPGGSRAGGGCIHECTGGGSGGAGDLETTAMAATRTSGDGGVGDGGRMQVRAMYDDGRAGAGGGRAK